MYMGFRSFVLPAGRFKSIVFDVRESKGDGCFLGEPAPSAPCPAPPCSAPPLAVCCAAPTRPWYVRVLDSACTNYGYGREEGAAIRGPAVVGAA